MHIPEQNAPKFHLEREGWQVIGQPLRNTRFTKVKPQKNLITFALCCQILVMFYLMYFNCCLVLVFLDHKFFEAGFRSPVLLYVFYNMKFITDININIKIYIYIYLKYTCNVLSQVFVLASCFFTMNFLSTCSWRIINTSELTRQWDYCPVTCGLHPYCLKGTVLPLPNHHKSQNRHSNVCNQIPSFDYQVLIENYCLWLQSPLLLEMILDLEAVN